MMETPLRTILTTPIFRLVHHMKIFPKSLKALHIKEPLLCFKYGQESDYPRDGLFLFGPETQPDRREITLGVIGTEKGIRLFRSWMEKLRCGVKVSARGPRDKKNRLHLSNFSGLKEVFGINVSEDRLVSYTLKREEIEKKLLIANPHECVASTVDYFLHPIKDHMNDEERQVDLWVLVVPEDVFTICRPQAISKRKEELIKGKFPVKQTSRTDMPLFDDLLDTNGEEIFDDVPDFHRLVKAKLLNDGVPSQIIRETTLAPYEFLDKTNRPIRPVQDNSTVAWNLASGLYYKTQAHPPWRLANMRRRVCYVGLCFKLIPNHPSNHACCAAQMFLSEGDGVVFRGANGPWLTDKKEFHLSNVAAKSLIMKVLETFRKRFDEFPSELFIHGTTKFNDHEWSAFQEAAPQGTNIVGVRIRPSHGEMKLYRDGDYPVLRGTAIMLDNSNAFLWTSGYTPRIDTYLGPETPNPLFISILRSTDAKPDIEIVLTDIMGLTKINYNACNFSDSEPVTIRFANRVGEILVMGSARDCTLQPFKFYI